MPGKRPPATAAIAAAFYALREQGYSTEALTRAGQELFSENTLMPHPADVADIEVRVRLPRDQERLSIPLKPALQRELDEFIARGGKIQNLPSTGALSRIEREREAEIRRQARAASRAIQLDDLELDL